jgi:hypothetical protein
VYRSTNRAQSWTAISPDLTDGPGTGNVTFGTITTVAVAESDPQVIWAGTDDANVWCTFDGGANWWRTDATLPERWVTRVAIDPTDATVSYVTFSGFRWDDPLPHVFRSTDYGASWTDVSSDLPEMPVNDIVIDPQRPARLFVATDLGVYVSEDTGGSWSALGFDLPMTIVTDLELHSPTRTLYAGTYGRSMWAYEIDTAAAVVESERGPASVPRLQPVTPNPLRTGSAQVRFTLPRAADLSLRLYDAGGRLVSVLGEERFAAGEHTLTWDGRDLRGRRVASGVYLVRLAGDGSVRTRKLTVLE